MNFGATIPRVATPVSSSAGIGFAVKTLSFNESARAKDTRLSKILLVALMAFIEARICEASADREIRAQTRYTGTTNDLCGKSRSVTINR
jgi:hypothetical protein